MPAPLCPTVTLCDTLLTPRAGVRPVELRPRVLVEDHLDPLLGATSPLLDEVAQYGPVGSVSGGCSRLRGHSLRARTTLSSAAYKVTWAPTYSHDSKPRTIAKNPSTALALRS